MELVNCCANPLNSWPRVKGVASCYYIVGQGWNERRAESIGTWRWVRPILTTDLNSSAFFAIAFLSFSNAGKSLWLISMAAAMCMAVGNLFLLVKTLSAKKRGKLLTSHWMIVSSCNDHLDGLEICFQAEIQAFRLHGWKLLRSHSCLFVCRSLFAK